MAGRTAILLSLLAHTVVATFGDEVVVKDGTEVNSRCSKEGGQKEGSICDPIKAKVCQNGSCDSVCGLGGLVPCSCPAQADRECYRCCGNAQNSCKPAHLYNIYKPNGERWEKASCSVCRDMEDGLPCDDKDNTKLCKNGRCTSDLCGGLREGETCDKGETKICVDNKCIEPCPAGMMLCDCDLAYRSLEVSADRCQLCCYDFSARECRNAHRHYGVTDANRRPVPRSGLACARGKTCDRYGTCAKSDGGRTALAPALLLLLLANLLR